MKRLFSVFSVLILIFGLSACGTNETSDTPAGQESASSAPAKESEPTPEQSSTTSEASSEPTVPRFEAGETATIAGITLTIKSVEVSKEIPTTDGTSLKAEEGEQLVLVKTHFVNSGDKLVDLSCSGPEDAFIQAWDEDNREMAPLFEGDRIEGNPECNKNLLQGQEHSWNMVFRAIDGSVPLGLTIIESMNFEDEIHMLFPEP